jgi:beta-lactamase superfamily II metal-dependent hydrolase/methylphosphotriester-DNA--protein-cysteine methyltransferase
MKNRLSTIFPLFLLLFFIICGYDSTLSGQSTSPNQPQPSASPLTVYALDIGQGDSFLIVSPTGKTVLIDTGDTGNEQNVTNALLNHAGGKKIDLFIASHPHQDHIGVAAEVIKGSTVARVLDSGYPHTTKTYERFLLAVKESGTQYIQAVPGQTFDIGSGAVISVLAPIKPYFTKSELREGATEPNANSVVVRLDYKSFSMIFTGDAEAETEARMIANKANLRAKILKVGHHGSRYATSEAFLQAVRPDAAVISVGGANKYGHPTQEALDRLKNSGVKVYRTDLQGEIKITSDGSTYQINTQKVASLTAMFIGRTSGDEAKSNSTTPTSPEPAATAKPAPANEPTPSGQIIGNKNSKIYHTPGCSTYDKVSEKNRVSFKSVEEAEAAGYRRAKNCSPSEQTPATQSTTIVPSAKPSPDGAITTETPSTSTQAAVIGNKNSKIYHRLGCPGYKTVSEKNQVQFNSVEEAEKAGYRAAKNCPPSN